MYSKLMLAVLLLAVVNAARAGVEMDMVTSDTDGAGTETMKIYAQAGMVRMDDNSKSARERVSMIFRNQELIVLNHKDQGYMVLDEATMAKIGGQIDTAMQQMQAQLANMPAEQRAMVEQMMKGQMGGMMGGNAEPPPVPSVQKTGSGAWQSGPCTEYAVLLSGVKTQEICAAALGDIDGADEMMRAFRAMAAFLQKIAASMPGPMAASMADNPMGLMDQIQGFPVRTRDFADGELRSETTLDAVVERDLDETLFDIPDGYKRQDPFSGR